MHYTRTDLFLQPVKPPELLHIISSGIVDYLSSDTHANTLSCFPNSSAIAKIMDKSCSHE